MIRSLLCRLFGHRWQRQREAVYSEWDVHGIEWEYEVFECRRCLGKGKHGVMDFGLLNGLHPFIERMLADETNLIDYRNEQTLLRPAMPTPAQNKPNEFLRAS